MHRSFHKNRQRIESDPTLRIMTRPQLSQNEFEAYLLIYAAYADYDFHSKEEEFIREFSSNEVFEKMHQVYLENSDYNSLQLIIRHMKEFLTDIESKRTMYDTILSLFKIDGDYSRGEKTFLEFLDKLIDGDVID